MEKGVHELAIEPFAKIILEGNASCCVEKLNSMMLLTHTRRDKVVKSLITIFGSLARLQMLRPDLFEWILLHCTDMNDNNIENQNASTAANLPKNQLLTPEIVCDAMFMSEIRRASTTSKSVCGEIRKDEEAFTKDPKLLADQTFILNKMVEHMQMFAQLDVSHWSS